MANVGFFGEAYFGPIEGTAEQRVTCLALQPPYRDMR